MLSISDDMTFLGNLYNKRLASDDYILCIHKYTIDILNISTYL
jgi:hypothetical protein